MNKHDIIKDGVNVLLKNFKLIYNGLNFYIIKVF